MQRISEHNAMGTINNPPALRIDSSDVPSAAGSCAHTEFEAISSIHNTKLTIFFLSRTIEDRSPGIKPALNCLNSHFFPEMPRIRQDIS